MFIETSAKAGHNVKTMFRKIAQALPGMDREQEGQGQNQSKSTPTCSPRESKRDSEEERLRTILTAFLPLTVIDVSVTPQNTTGNEGGCSC